MSSLLRVILCCRHCAWFAGGGYCHHIGLSANKAAVWQLSAGEPALQDALLVVGTELLDLYLASDGSEYDADDAAGEVTPSSGFGSSGDGSSAGEHSTGGTSSGTASSLSPAMSMARAASRTMAGASGIGSGAFLRSEREHACQYRYLTCVAWALAELQINDGDRLHIHSSCLLCNFPLEVRVC